MVFENFDTGARLIELRLDVVFLSPRALQLSAEVLGLSTSRTLELIDCKRSGHKRRATEQNKEEGVAASDIGTESLLHTPVKEQLGSANAFCSIRVKLSRPMGSPLLSLFLSLFDRHEASDTKILVQ